MTTNNFTPAQSELGKPTHYQGNYHPDILFPIPRQEQRQEIGVPTELPFYGFDLWNHYEVSWLNEKGKPIVALAEIIYDCKSINIIESKSMKLYFNSFNNKSFIDAKSVENTVKKDIEAKIIGSTVTVNIMPLNTLRDEKLHLHLNGQCLDNLDIDCDTYSTDSSLLTTEDVVVEEIVYSHLLKSNCLVTNQPDFGSVEIAYKGKKINHAGLLRYIISFRNHNEFHEQCIERIFMDIMRQCQPQELTVYGRYTRRGGLDINPYRSTQKIIPTNLNNRLSRQ